MFYVDIWEGRVADWVPLFGGDYLSLWPIFNIADASIFCGVTVILIFQKVFFKEKIEESEAKEESIVSTDVSSDLESEQVSGL